MTNLKHCLLICEFGEIITFEAYGFVRVLMANERKPEKIALKKLIK
jgi:hypothetical protein